jgi:hypothetical protein
VSAPEPLSAAMLDNWERELERDRTGEFTDVVGMAFNLIDECRRLRAITEAAQGLAFAAKQLAIWEDERVDAHPPGKVTHEVEGWGAEMDAAVSAVIAAADPVRLPEPEPAASPDYQDIEDAIRDALSHLCLREDDIGRAARDVHRSLTVAASPRLPEKGEPAQLEDFDDMLGDLNRRKRRG